MDLFLRNLRYTLRTMSRNPGVTLIALITLAIGIGANTAIFSIVNSFLLRPLPFREPDQLVAVYAVPPNFDRSPASYSEFQAWRDQNKVFSGLTGLFESTFNWTGGAEPVRIQGALVTEKFFETFGTVPLKGRTFLPEDHKGDGHVVVLSQGFWVTQLGGAPDVIGRTLTLDGLPYIVVGVMPESAPDFTPDRQTSLWVPFEPNRPMYAMNPTYHFVRVFGRLKDGVTMEQAQSGMGLVAKQVTGYYRFLQDTVTVAPLRDVLVGRLRTGLVFLLGTVIFLLLIACANIANLLMIRAATRRRELAVRRSLGASRAQLVRQMLAESLVINILGGGLGLLLAIVTEHWLLVFWPANIPRPYQLGIDWRVLGFTASISLATGILFGLGPALIGSKVPALELLNQGSSQTGMGARQSRFFSFVVIAEFALATLLMVGAGLLVKSFLRLEGIDPGFQSKGLITAQITIPEYEFRQGTATYRRIIEQIQTLPGVEAVGATTFLPLATKDYELKLHIQGQSFPAGQEPVAALQLVTPGFFGAMHTPLLAGRSFTERDTRDAPRVVIVNEAMARRFWPNDVAVGKLLDSGLFGAQGWQQVVGVVGDIRTKGLDEPAGLQIYLPYTEFSNLAMTVTVRANVAASSLTPAIEKAVLNIHPGLPVRVKAMEGVLQDSVAPQRTAAVLPLLFAVCGLVLSCMGIYGVTSYVITRRTREIGIRIALGAGPHKVLLLIFRHGLLLTLAGAGLGLIGAFMLTRLLSRWLFGISPFDPQTFVIACVALATVAAVATYLPARRATRVNPMVALRED